MKTTTIQAAMYDDARSACLVARDTGRQAARFAGAMYVADANEIDRLEALGVDVCRYYAMTLAGIGLRIVSVPTR